MKSTPARRRVLLTGALLVLVVILVTQLGKQPRSGVQNLVRPTPYEVVQGTANPVASKVNPASPAQPAAVAAAVTPLADGKDIDSIRKWAHNDLEVQRMVEENNRIIRRELVKFKETPAAAIERLRLSGEPVRELILPAMDGQSIRFEITTSDVDPSGLRGMFSGRIAGQPDSLVTLAFAKNKQAYTVLSPSAGIYLTADAHDSGDAILKSIQPDIYASGYCGNP